MNNTPAYIPFEIVTGEYPDNTEVEPLRHAISINIGTDDKGNESFLLKHGHPALPTVLSLGIDFSEIRVVPDIEEARVACRTILIDLFGRSYREQKVPSTFVIGLLKTTRNPV